MAWMVPISSGLPNLMSRSTGAMPHLAAAILLDASPEMRSLPCGQALTLHAPMCDEDSIDGKGGQAASQGSGGPVCHACSTPRHAVVLQAWAMGCLSCSQGSVANLISKPAN